MGIQAQRAVAPRDVDGCLKWLLESEGPALLEVVTDKKVPVLPMVPGGKALHEFLVYDEGITSSNCRQCQGIHADRRHSQRKRKTSGDEKAIWALRR